MDNLRELLGIRRKDKVLKVERVGNDKINKRVYVGECAGSHSVGRLML